jgi:predicted O-methyltransferase YrrM
MDDVVSPTVAALAGEVGPDPDDVLEEMAGLADRRGFPTVGPEVGGWLTVLTRLVDARRVFEFGSGFGYSAYWFARGLPADGEVVLTEVDADELDRARDFFDRGRLADRARFEHGDAVDVVEGYDGPFDVVLIDNEKDRYLEAFRAVEGKLRSGGVVLADNAVTADTVEVEDVLALLRGTERPAASAASVGIARYLEAVGGHEDFETALLPLGEGVAVSHRR